MSKIPVIAGLDPSYTSFAVCLGDGVNEEIKCFSSQNPGKTKQEKALTFNRMKRLELLAASIDALLSSNRPDVIVIENYSFASEFNREMMAELGAIIRWHLVDFTPYVFNVAPGTLKKFTTGKGSSKKDQMAMHVFKRWGKELNNNDEVDAYAMYRLGLCAAGSVPPDNKPQEEAVKTLLKDIDLKMELSARFDTPAF